MTRIALIPGDGIGSEVTREAAKVLRALDSAGGPSMELVEWDLGAERYLRTGHTISDDEVAELAGYDAIFLGAMGDPRVPGNEHARDILLGLRFRLDLFVNLRPVRLIDARQSPLKGVRPEDVDLLIVRENTEGAYVGMGGVFKRGTPDEVALEEDVNTRKGVERIIRAAFQLARDRERRKVTLADKANAMRHVGSLWRRTFADVGRDFPEIQHEAVYIDALCMDLVLHPARYDVIVASNLFGDIVSDVAAALVGGLGLAPSANLHPGGVGLFEPVHGSAPDIAGQARANPLAAILTAAMLLDHVGRGEAADRVRTAVERVIREGHSTPDLGGSLRTDQVGDRICQALSA